MKQIYDSSLIVSKNYIAMKSCNIHVDLSDQSMFNWQPLSDQGAFGDIYTATIPERVIRPSGSTSRLIKVRYSTQHRRCVLNRIVLRLSQRSQPATR